MKGKKDIRNQIELWLILVFLTSLGWPLGLILTSGFLHVIGTEPDSFLSVLISGVVGGAIVNLLGISVLRKSINSVGKWILMATLGWSLGLVGTSYMIQFDNSTASWIMGGAVGGFIYGLLQQFGFKPKSRKGFEWVIMHAFGWAGAYGFGIVIPPDLLLSRFASISWPISRGLLGWVMLGVIAVFPLILAFSTTNQKDKEPRVQWWP